jgi:NADPH-dependent curcumin reductase
VTTRTNPQWRLKSRPTGPVGEQNFEWSEGTVSSLAEGEVLVRNEWISFDPHLAVDIRRTNPARGAVPIGAVVPAIAVGEVVESRRPDFVVGDRVQGLFGWERYTVTDGGGFLPMARLPRDVPAPLALGTLGMTGMTAYFGVRVVGAARRGETMVVSGAAGAVGSVATQIGRIEGLHVVGIAGGKAKCKWLRDEARVDGAIDYRSEDVDARLSELCRQGIDVFFDNVGGPVLDSALARLRRNGRVVLCGAISRYESATPSPGPANYPSLILRHGKMEGFLISDYVERFPEALAALGGWWRAGEIRTREDIVVGLEHAPRAFARLFSGENFGKQLLRIDANGPG